jgi:exopolysaccharide biosynthesis polyprenyl glycosylphosphotransferase
MLIIAALIKMTSKGPIFYGQKRMGLDGEIFEMLKFRSMVVDAEKDTGSMWAKPDDPRRTPIGRILRKTSLDEFPQLFNVLKGEMSLVGPRPERPELIEQFKHKVPKYMLRHKIKAGMTGWAQVNGWRGNTSLEKRIEHDLYYIENWSLSFDLRILFLTIFRGWVSKHAY